MEISPDGAKALVSALPVGLLIIAVHTRGLQHRIRLVPKRVALVVTLLTIFVTIVSIGLCFWSVNTGQSVAGFAAWFVVVASVALALQVAGTFYEFVVISMREEKETA